MSANCTKTPENHGGEVFQLEHSFSDLWMILKAAKSHSSGHVGIICQRGLGSTQLVHLSCGGLAWGCFTAKDKRQPELPAAF